jgi:F0F1-type ATP synthase assembly protein I
VFLKWAIFFTVISKLGIIIRVAVEGNTHLKKTNDTHRMLAYFMQFSINMLVPIGLCSFIGYLIDEKLGTSCFFVILFFIGALAGFRNIYILVKKVTKKPDEENNSDDSKDR